jgi:hypothetical protein
LPVGWQNAFSPAATGEVIGRAIPIVQSVPLFLLVAISLGHPARLAYWTLGQWPRDGGCLKLMATRRMGGAIGIDVV